MRLLLSAAFVALATAPAMADEIRIAHIHDMTGALEAYAAQSQIGLMMGLEYATEGTMQVEGNDLVVTEYDSQLRPDLGRALLAQAFGDDGADIAVGPTSSGVALAMLPVAEEYERILLVEPAVADSITGADWNRYIFRTGRNSSQDAISNAIALGQEGVVIATLAQDYAFGRDGIAAFREALEGTPARLVHEEYAPTDTTDFTAAAERIFNALQEHEGDRRLFVIWAGGNNPMSRIQAMDPGRFGIQMATGGNILPAMVSYRDFPGMEGATYYYYEIPQNPVNQWFVEQHMERYGTPPDFFTAGGMAAGIAIVEALRASGGSTDAEDLITAMEGMHFETPKGEMWFRAEDHQAMQSMYHFRIAIHDGVEWAVPELVREITPDMMDIPIRNQ
ncbi:substrate-binding domain-containing protein [Pararhodobacter aggregans]|uniref:ABC transporter permease n=1 Tax=Pararhodobacter aggregans TaxID=404875 RepID=A0A2T7UUI4_9RHOB|nr:substrate-binding domain-containing protein [Pararhodobacter aggregans]PTX02769.1 amino acid/amide ABC transporter substrate-binding protein (HAAT family) [Pararhodobacter aggregans]PVE48256.1 ABC transporter permease [Pararhodobacter aggregans]